MLDLVSDLGRAVVACFLLPVIVLVAGGALFLLLADTGLLMPVLFTLLGFCVALTSMGICAKVRALRQDLTVRRSEGGLSEEARRLTVQLFGGYPPYVVEAAQQLGEQQEMYAVPALLCVLERSISSQNPGWCEVSEAIVVALGKIGDGRALPLLYKLQTVRGIGIVAVVREAIDAIEPHSCLLRAGSADMGQETLLVRPATERTEAKEHLLRSVR